MNNMKSGRKKKFNRKGFQMLNKQALSRSKAVEYIVLCLMIAIAVTSIVWSLSMHLLSGDFYNGFIAAKLVFRERDLSQMENAEKALWQHDLDRILNETYTIEALEKIKANALILPKLTDNQPPTKKSKSPKISHIIRTKNSNVPEPPKISNLNINEDYEKESTTKVPKQFNIEEDSIFLSRMTIDIHQTRWSENIAVKFIYSFSFFSEIIAIIWTAMCFVFQSGVKKAWGLPKPWRIVVPSIVMFSIMTVATLTYLLLANDYLKTFCNDLRAHLSKPDAISCGAAMAVLRPVIRPQTLSHNTYLMLFRTSYTSAMTLWIFALCVMLIRFFLAIDFRLVDVETICDREVSKEKLREQGFVEVQLNSPTKSIKSTDTMDMKYEHKKSDDDFQSAKSHLSEMTVSLLDQLGPTQAELKT